MWSTASFIQMRNEELHKIDSKKTEIVLFAARRFKSFAVARKIRFHTIIIIFYYWHLLLLLLLFIIIIIIIVIIVIVIITITASYYY